MPRFLSLGLLAIVSSSALAVPTTTNHQGRLFDGLGAPLTGTHDITFEIYDAPASGGLLWSETHTVAFDSGYYAIELGSTSPLDDAVLEGGSAFLQLTVDTNPPIPGRLTLNSVPYAVIAGNVRGGIVDASEIRIDGTTVIDSSGSLVQGLPPDVLDGDSDVVGALTCLANDIAQYDGSNWTCQPRDHQHPFSEITGILDINQVPVGSGSSEVAAGDHLHAASTLTGVITSSQLPTDMGSVVDSYVVDGALDLDGGTTIGSQPISTGAHYSDTDAIAALSPHTGDASAHHAAYTDTDAIAALAPHTGDAAAHHAKYTDAEARAAVGADIEAVGRNDSRVAFAGTWIDSGGWGNNRFAPGQARYTNCTNNDDCSADTITLSLDGNTYGSVLMSHLDWSNTRAFQVHLSFDGGANYAYHKTIQTHRPNADSTPYTSQNRVLASNLPQGADVRVRLIASHGRLHFEGFGLTERVMAEGDERAFRQLAWATGRGADGTCDVNSSCGPSPLGSRVLTFVKTQAQTAVRIQYVDNMRSYGANGDRACRWHIYLNGSPCPSGSIHADVYASQLSNTHRQRPLTGFCTGLPAGTYTVQAYVQNSPGYNARCYTGWLDSTWTLEAEEVR